MCFGKEANLVALSYIQSPRVQASLAQPSTPLPWDGPIAEYAEGPCHAACQISCHRIVHQDLGLGPVAG